jgi:hypothetical protein
MKNILFYGNCQLEKIKDILCLPSDQFTLNFIPCFLTEYTDVEFDWIIKNSDVIITQPVIDNYRDKYYLSSNYVVNKCKENAVIIFLNNCHFDFYYFDLTYKEKYIHSCMVDCIQKKTSVDYYNEKYVKNINLKTKDELLQIYNKTISELNNRYQNMLQYRKHNTHFINIIPFIENNYKNKLLFYTFNHPTKHLLQFIALEIIKFLNIPDTIDYNLDPFTNERCILYSCIQKIVHFNIKEFTPLMHGSSDINDIFDATKAEV